MDENATELQSWTPADWHRVDTATLAMKRLLTDTVAGQLSDATMAPTWRALEAQILELLDTIDELTAQQRSQQPGH
ncbi:MAG: hypothetical protein E2601_06355 [Microbacterium sp.]|nr:hypothetical protein [Microbacterium sp.]